MTVRRKTAHRHLQGKRGMVTKTAVDASYQHCRQVARHAGSSFYTAFFLLPRTKRRAMWALYAFLRHTDDLGDDEVTDLPRDNLSGSPPAASDLASRRRSLAAWRHSLEQALGGRCDHPLLPALKDTVDRYEIPHEYLTAAVDGVEMDLDRCRYATFDELKLYCHRVASVVGLACIHIWGFRDRAALGPAVDCGIAFQLTNILRDLTEDVRRGRVYLPQCDLDRFGYTTDDLRAGVSDDRFRKLMRFEIDRAEEYYRTAEPLAEYLHDDGRRILRALVDTYHGLLCEIRKAGGHVLDRRVRVGRLRKVWIAAHAWLSGRL